MKKLISLVLALAMVLGSVAFAPAPAYADEPSGIETPPGSSKPAASSEVTTGPAISANFVLMNIPYEKFYQAEGVEGVDAVTSATKMKPRTGTLAGGSYHVNGDGTDISGVIYPVKVDDMETLKSKGYDVITDDSAVTITVTNRGRESTTEYQGKDALFEAGDYSYYALSNVPSYYMELTAADMSFSEVKGDIATVNGAGGEVTVGARHAAIEIALSGTAGIAQGDAVSGVVVTFDDDSKLGLRHVAEIWRATELGGSTEQFGGKTIKNIRYYKPDAVIDFPVEIEISDAGYTLMNIPYNEFYAAEGVEGVDAVTSATKKAYNSGLVGGSYHDTEDASYASTDILGVTYPVFVEDKSVLDPEKAVEADALFAAGDYAYAVLDGTPSASKKLTLEGETYSFAAIGGRPAALNAEVSVSAVTKRGDYEIEIKNADVLSNATVYGIVLTAGEEKFALRHLENIWKGVELAVCTGHTETIKDGAVTPVTYDLEGKTISGITYYVKDAEGVYRTYTIDCEVEIPAYPAASFTDAKTIKIEGLTEEDAAKTAINKDSGENKYYYARVMKSGETIETELTIAEDGTIVLSSDAASGDYTVDIIQYNTKKDEAAVMVSMTASYTADDSGSHSGGKSSKSDKTEEQPAAEETPAADPMEGISPKKNVTRGDMIQALYRLSGEKADGKDSFTDDNGKAYEEAVAWAEEKGITAGIAAGEFGGDLAITREQMVTMFYLYAQKFGKDTAIAAKPDFDDMNEVSSWAVNAVKWAYGKDLVCGVGNNTFDPKSTATGEQLAIVMKNFQQMK